MFIEGLDEVDNRILELLKDNARMSFTDVGKDIGISRVAVKNRVERMETAGIIKGFYTEINSTKVSEGTKFFLDIEAYPENYEDVLELLSKQKTIKEVYSITGDCRIHVVGFSNSSKELYGFVDRLYRSDSGVRRLGCHTALATIIDVDGGIKYEHIKRKKEPGDHSGD